MAMRISDEIFAGMRREDFIRQAHDSVFKIDGNIFKLRDCAAANDEETGELRFKIIGEELAVKGWVGKAFIIRKKEDVPKIDFSFPDTGYFNYKLGAIYLGRNASRQWRLGYNSAVVTMVDSFIREREMKNILTEDLSIPYHPQLIRQVFNRKYFSLEKALVLLKEKKRIACAVNKYICVGVSCEYDKPIICYKGKIVGYIGDKNIPTIFEDAEYISVIFPCRVNIKRKEI